MQTHTANLSRANTNRTCGPDKSFLTLYLHLSAAILTRPTTADIRPRESDPAATARDTGSVCPPGICHFPFTLAAPTSYNK